MALTTAERNRRKRERKKREREERRRLEEEEAKELAAADPRRPEEEVEVEYVAEELVLPPTSVSGASGEVINGEAGVKVEGEMGEGGGDDEGIAAVLRRFQSRSSVTVTDDEAGGKDGDGAATDGEEEGGGGDDDDEGAPSASSRRLREAKRPTIAELKNRVARSDLVEAHDVTAPDPDFLLQLKSVPGTVPVPRHWGRKRKYLQGKVGGSVHFGPVSVSDRCSHARGTHPIMCFVSSLPPSLFSLSLLSLSLSLCACDFRLLRAARGREAPVPASGLHHRDGHQRGPRRRGRRSGQDVSQAEEPCPRLREGGDGH